MKLRSSRSIPLAISFLTGQGTAFLGNVFFLNAGQSHIAGPYVLLMAAFSFALLFSEVGGSTVLVRRLCNGQTEAAASFIVGRVIVAFIATGVACYVLFWPLRVPLASIGITAIGFSMAASVFGRAALARYESRSDYWRICLTQSSAWIIYSSTVFLLLLTSSGQLTVELAGFVAAGTALVHSYASGPGLPLRPQSTYFRSTIDFISYTSGTLVGQLWGRSMLAIVAGYWGVATVGEMSIARQVEIGAILLFGFYIRPRVAEEARTSDHSPEPRRPLNGFERPILMLALALSICGLAILPLVQQFGDYKPGWIDWLPLLGGIFCAVLMVIFSQFNHLKKRPSTVLGADAAAMCLSATTFLLLCPHSPLLAFLIAEAIPGMVHFIVWRTGAG